MNIGDKIKVKETLGDKSQLTDGEIVSIDSVVVTTKHPRGYIDIFTKHYPEPYTNDYKNIIYES